MQLSIHQIALMSRLLDEALPLDAAGRRLWLERLSPEYQDLAPALREALLPTDSQAARFNALATLPRLASAGEGHGLSANGLQAGAHVGPYELIRLLGAGGMAEVWLARRADGAFKREVALKLPTLTHLQDDLERRFVRERDILASLEHPQIARFYDAGIDPNGLLYVAMEYVRGEPLTSWCDAHRLGISARLELFVEVLAGVQYAHEKHVVHRDLKPSNILVTESGHVRLLDFGVAKLLESEEAEKTPLTAMYGRALTPDYASPELLRGDPINPRSDVYSLGVVLYELLTGVRPYRLKSAASMGLLEQAIDSVEVRKPSTQIEPEAIAICGTTPQKLAHQLRGDLDAIALKSLAKEPEERYPSATALAQDLQLYLEGRPIRAQPARLPYRLRKFVRRNKAMVGVSTTAVAAILAAVGYSLYREAVHQAKITAVAVLPAAVPEKSIAVLPFVDMSEKKDQDYFADGMAEEILNLLTKIPELKVIGRTSSFQFKGKTDDLRKIGTALGTAYVVEGSVRRSVDHIRVTAQLIDARDGARRWSETYDRDASDALKVQDEIATSLVRALQLEVTSSSPVQGRAVAESSEAYDSYLRGLHSLNRYDQQGFEEAAAHFRHALEIDPSFAPAAAQLARTLNDVAGWGFVPPQTGQEQSRVAAEAALKLDSKSALASALAHAVLAMVHIEYDWNWPAAERETRTAVTLAPNYPNVMVCAVEEHLALGRWNEALRFIDAAIAADPLQPALHNLRGLTYLRLGRLAEAESAYRRISEISPTYVGGHYGLGIVLLIEEKTEAALVEMQKETSGSRQTLGLAMIYYLLHRRRDADAALARLEAESAADMASGIAEAYAFRGQKDQAFKWLDRAYAQKDRSLWLIKGDPLLKNLEGDPRYEAFLRMMNLPD